MDQPRRTPLAELADGATVDNYIVLVTRKEDKVTNGGKPYWKLAVRDSTMELDCMVWDIPKGTQLEAGDFIEASAQMGSFNNNPQLTARNVFMISQDAVDLRDFLPHAARPGEEMLAELRHRIMTEVKNEEIRDLLIDVIENMGIKGLLIKAAAASKNHHAYIGGLLEHILSLWGAASGIVTRYAYLDLDILHAACVLHDIGKIKEITVDKTIEYSPIGNLVGHVMIGSQIVWNIMARRKVSQDVQLHILHIIASHHGFEFGVTKPQSPEAIAFHFLDNMDARLCAVEDAFTKDRDRQPFVKVPILGYNNKAWRGHDKPQSGE